MDFHRVSFGKDSSFSTQLLIQFFYWKNATAEDEKSACEHVNQGVIDAAITRKG